MTYTLVEDLSTNDATVLVRGRTFPVPALVEDPDGIRALLLADTGPVSARTWVSAHSGGAEFLVVCHSESLYAVMSAEDFMERRTENARTATFEASGWSGYLDPAEVPTYRGLMTGEGSTPVSVVEPTDADASPEPGTGFVHLHTHSEYSQLDGLSKIPEMVAAAVADGQSALAVSDHGTCAGHPDLQKHCEAAGIKPIFGMEAYLVPDRHRRGTSWFEHPDAPGVRVRPEDFDDKTRKSLVKKSDAQEALGEYTHITLWAADDAGLRNLWAMSTEGHAQGFYGKPRIDFETLSRLGAGVIASTGCLRGPVSNKVLKGDFAGALQDLARLMEIFPDRLYVEIHTNHLEEQVLVNQYLVGLAREHRLPMIAAVDSHYAAPEHKPTHRAWLAMQTNKDLTDDTSLFAGGQDYHMKTAAEVREALAYLGPDVVTECLANTVALAERCTAQVRGATTTPIFTRPSKDFPTKESRIAHDVDRLIDQCLDPETWRRKIIARGVDQDTAMARFEREMSLLIAKRFCGYFLVVADFVNWAKSQGCLVGPGRGSGGGSLVAYLCGITELEPIDNDLIFERFLTEGRDSLPDFDIDFPSSWRTRVTNRVIERWGEDYVTRIGTTTRLQSKGAFNDSARVLKDSLPYEVAFTDQKLLKAAIDAADAPLAGKHMPWEDFCTEFADIVGPMREKYPEVFALTDTVVTRVKTYGKHAAGVVISTDAPLTDLPMRLDNDGQLVTQFDMVALEQLGYVKFDLLTLRTLDTIQDAVDLVRERFGHQIDVYSWTSEYNDPQVWDAVSSGQTLGLFQIETRAGTRLTRRFQPHSLHDLAAVMTIVRPGPKNSGLQDAYLRRRSGVEPVSFPEPRLEQVLGATYGCLIYQEQIMQTCTALAGYDGNEADEVRSILGKKKIEKIGPAGDKFIARAVENGTDRGVAEALWQQMAEFAKYSFNKAHAFGYSVLGYWTAWLKFHYPVQFLTAALSTVKAERIPDFINEARRMGYSVAGPDVNESKIHFTPGQTTVRFGLASVAGVGEDTAAQIVAGAPYSSLEDFITRQIEPKGSKVNRGHLASLVAVGAFDSLVSNRRAVEMQLEAEKTGAATTCVHQDREAVGPGGLPCRFDWEHEIDPPLIPRGRGKLRVLVPKAPPKRCTTACRNYTRPPALDPATVVPYTEDDIMEREKELLGVWLSATPFDRIPAEYLDLVATAEEVESGPSGCDYTVAALVEGVREKTDVNGGRYAFVTLGAQNGSLDAICFASTYEKIRRDLRTDGLVIAVLAKTDRGLTLLYLMPAAALTAA